MNMEDREVQELKINWSYTTNGRRWWQKFRQKRLKEESEMWKHFLVESEMENVRHRVSDFDKDNLDP